MKFGNVLDPFHPATAEPADAGSRKSKSKSGVKRVNRKARLQRVAEVRQAIRDGSFRVSAARIADAMIRQASERIERAARGVHA